MHGHTDIVKIFLQRLDVNPGANNNQALGNGHTDILKLLLRDSRADQSAQFNQPFSIYRHTDAVKLPLADKRVNTSDKNNAGKRSIYLGPVSQVEQQYDILYLLLADGRADPSVNNNQILASLRSTKNLLTIELLEKDDFVKSIEFLNIESKPLTTTTFLNLFNSPLKWGTSSCIESVFAQRSNDLVLFFISDMLMIPIKEAKSIHNLDEFDRLISLLNAILSNRKRETIKQLNLKK